MDLTQFDSNAPGELIKISGSDPVYGDWEHRAFLPMPLPDEMPALSVETILMLAEARAQLSALNTSAQRLPNPGLLRQPSIRREAQSTSALEGTYAPLHEVLMAESVNQPSAELSEVVNYVRMANAGYEAVASGRMISRSLLNELHAILMSGTRLEAESGALRTGQVVIGKVATVSPRLPPVQASRFVPVPAGDHLVAGLDELFRWKSVNHSDSIDPLVKAGMGHYQFETLHPFRDGNGRLGRYLIVTDLLQTGVLSEPTLTVSPWFEARRQQYYDALLAVSTVGDWDGYLRFFLQGLANAAESTLGLLQTLITVQEQLKLHIREAGLRSESAHHLVDLALGELTFSISEAAQRLGITDGGARRVAEQLVELGILKVLEQGRGYRRWYYAPHFMEVFSQASFSNQGV